MGILAKNADLLIAECALAPGKVDTNWPHLNPEQAARIARDSKVKKLALVHFDAAAYKRSRDRNIAETKAKGIFKNSIAVKDDTYLKI